MMVRNRKITVLDLWRESEHRMLYTHGNTATICKRTDREKKDRKHIHPVINGKLSISIRF